MSHFRSPDGDVPEATPENVPDEVLRRALGIATRYVRCPDCGHEQFVAHTPGMNTWANCDECGAKAGT